MKGTSAEKALDKHGEDLRSSKLLAVIQKILGQKNKIRMLTNMAFEAVDTD